MGRLIDYMGRVRRRQNGGQSGDRPLTAFVLSGGGVLGAVQVGQLRGLVEEGIVPDLVCATSVGALNGAMLAADPTPEGMAALAEIWAELRGEDVFPGSRVKRVWSMVARGDHIYPNDGLRRLVERLSVRTFQELRLPLHVSATDLGTGREHWFSTGPLMPALLASTALPGIFPPVVVDGQRYVDGGVVNNVPMSRAVELGARRVYVLTCGAGSVSGVRAIRRPLDVLVQAFAHARAVRYNVDLDRLAPEVEVVRVPAVETGFVRYDDFSHTRRLIARALDVTREFLARETAAVEA